MNLNALMRNRLTSVSQFLYALLLFCVAFDVQFTLWIWNWNQHAYCFDLFHFVIKDEGVWIFFFIEITSGDDGDSHPTDSTTDASKTKSFHLMVQKTMNTLKVFLTINNVMTHFIYLIHYIECCIMSSSVIKLII